MSDLFRISKALQIALLATYVACALCNSAHAGNTHYFTLHQAGAGEARGWLWPILLAIAVGLAGAFFWQRKILRILLPCLLLPSTFADGAPVSKVKPDEDVMFFPTIAYRAADGTNWNVEIHGCVYEPDKRFVELALLTAALELDRVKMTPAEYALFKERSRLFMVDHKGGRTIVFRVAGREFGSGTSRADGQFFAIISLSDAEEKQFEREGARIAAVLPPKDKREFAVQVKLLNPSGITVISDIDDTVKITGVHDRKATLRNTFLEPFKAVPGMAAAYQRWAHAACAQFCYVSASPWQLFQPLSEFIRTNGFPTGPFYLKNFRWKDKSFFALFEGPEIYKPLVIEPLLVRFPERLFVLVGDSGERDPEIYGALARSHPQQVVRIFIRDVTGQASDSERYRSAFRDLPPAMWKVFRDPAEIEGEELLLGQKRFPISR